MISEPRKVIWWAASVRPSAAKPGSMVKPMTAKPTHGSAPSFLEAL